ncbi:thioredoxin family protein [Thioalkalivibrio sp.]|uniref:thioredoxin family protein n=1 Tax=Thioalkalivibrio sp. TaxID=2093813 RepID=UPI0012D6DB98|nr:thioredoxin family protein [Thioalkalivibrio sp.]TVP76776.1 MAG: thioredoxin family protein [Thioalkalivibrio sp.]
MRSVKVLGFSCANCKRAYKLIEDTACAKGLEIHLEKVEDAAEIAHHGILSMPGIVVDGQVVYMGGVPSRSLVEKWLS